MMSGKGPLQSIIVRLHSKYDAGQIRRKLPDLFEPLSGLLGAGVSLHEAVTFLEASITDAFVRKYLRGVRSGLDEGKSLQELIGIDGEPWLTTMLRGAQMSGALEEVLGTWAAQTKQQREWVQSILKSLAYPALLTASAIATLALIDVVVLPQFSSMYRQLGMKPSPITQAWVNLIRHLPLVAGCVFGVAVGIAILFVMIQRTRPRVWEQIRRRVPGYSLWRLAKTQRFAFILGMLVRAGVPLVEALQTTQSTGAKWLQLHAQQIADRVLAGATLSEVFDGDWDPVLHLQIRLAEASGQLGQALQHVDVYTRAQLQRRVGRSLKRIEPTLTLITGGLIGLTMLSLYAPMYSMMSTLNQ